MTVSFEIPESAEEHVDRIIQRVEGLCRENKMEVPDLLSLRMDLMACHANGTPLDWERLSAADPFNLGHDVFGIMKHMDRETGQLTGHFRPRFTAMEDAQ